MMYKSYLTTILFLFAVLSLHAQPPKGERGQGRPGGKKERPKIGKVWGKIIDSETNRPIEFATISLISRRKKSVAAGGITNAKGKFLIEQIPVGFFSIDITFIGYETITIDSVMLHPRRGSVERNLGTIKLASKASELDEIVVKEDKGLMQIGIDKRVFNVEKSLTSTGGSAEDVLANIPSIDVDIDGQVSLRGSANVTILIDGKPSLLTGGDRQAILEQLPANAIQSVEVITNPSAKYDPDGMSGIINIVLKKDRKKGLNGGISVGLGTWWNKYNASANINYRTKKYNLRANYSFRDSERMGSGELLRTTNRNDTLSLLDQVKEGTRGRASHMVSVGFEYYIDPNNTIGVEALYSPRFGASTEFIENKVFDNGELIDRYIRDNVDESKGYNMDYGLNYRRTFMKPKQELTASVNYSQGTRDGIDNFMEVRDAAFMIPSLPNPFLQNNIANRANYLMIAQADYVHPFSEGSKLEVGYKSTVRNIDNDFKSETFSPSENAFLEDVGLSNQFIYNEQVHAVYGIYAHSIGKNFSMQFGTRLEQALTNSELVTTGEKNPNNYFRVFPSAHFAQKLGNKQEMQLSYSRRINRPRSRTLNPFNDYADPLNIRRGNPNLLPEDIHAVELGYTKYWNKGSIVSAVYYRRVNDVINRLKTVNDQSVSTTSFENFGSATSYGVELIGTARPTKWWRLNASTNFFQTILDASNVDTDLTNSGIGYMGKLTSSMSFEKGFELQVSGRYRSPIVLAQGRIDPFYSADIAMKQKLFNGRADIGLRVRDVFNNFRFNIDIAGDNFTQQSFRKRESRIGYLTFSYRFGKQEKRRRGKGGRGGNSSGGGMEDVEF